MPALSIISGQVRDPNVQDLEKLVILCKYLNFNHDSNLVLAPEEMKVMKVYIDASLSVRDEMKFYSCLVL